jgi:hypothetical protein
MDWQGILGSAGQQNAIFWGGAAAVALGLTLLLATVVTRLRRRLRWRRPFSLPRIPALQAAGAYQAAGATGVKPVAAPADSAAAGLAIAARILAEAAVPPAPSLAILLRRLQLAGDRLEEVARSVSDDVDDFDDADLKDHPLEVEYVFKACGP